jgi:hypothetical protein
MQRQGCISYIDFMRKASYISPNLITKLTALWAVSESGLGGIFHAMKLPFSGLILGSFAVMIVTFMAMYTERKFRTIVQATLIVILIKAIASPHSPITAYVAVMFQGLVGAAIYALMDVSRFSAILYGVIALVESALQKLLMLVLIFGKNIWEAFQEFFSSLAKQFSLQSLELLPVVIVGIYCLIYFIGGILAGNFAVQLPQAIQNQAAFMKVRTVQAADVPPARKRKMKTRILGLAFIMLFIALVFILSGSMNKAIYSLLRTLAALGILFFVINPLFKYLLQRWKNSQKLRNKQQLNAVLEFVPQFRNHARHAYVIAEEESGMFRKIKTFLLTWMALALFSDDG